tara:strand:+ start:76 stop:342 length:267 start_codon:yes stop_codon:yes gene_type:complete
MNNKYRAQFIERIEDDIDQDNYVDPERLTKGLKYLDDARAIVKRKAGRLVKKYAAEVAAEGKNVDAELAAQGIVVGDDELAAELAAAE